MRKNSFEETETAKVKPVGNQTKVGIFQLLQKVLHLGQNDIDQL